MVAESSPVRALSWNVHGFVGRSGRRDPQAVMHAVRTLDADIVSLQEVVDTRRRGVATRTLCPLFEVAAGIASFPSRRPVFALDRIWSRAPLEPLRASVALEYRDLSDHLGVLADLRFTSARRGPHSG